MTITNQHARPSGSQGAILFAFIAFMASDLDLYIALPTTALALSPLRVNLPIANKLYKSQERMCPLLHRRQMTKSPGETDKPPDEDRAVTPIGNLRKSRAHPRASYAIPALLLLLVVWAIAFLLYYDWRHR
jgi:hypothetical protein